MRSIIINNPENNMKDNLIAWHIGVIGGITQWANNMYLSLGTISTMVEGAITAILCGFSGLLGKELFILVKKTWKQYKKNKSNKHENESE